jgi:hypothetical protein
MSPEQITLLAAVAKILESAGTWPIGTLIVGIMLGPWIVMGFVNRSMEKRHEAAVKMYEHNVKLVESYEKMAAEQVDTIRLSTAAITELVTYFKTRTPCAVLLAAKLGRIE